MNGPIRPLLLRLHRLVLRSGPALRPIWLSAYEVAIRAYGAYLTRGVSGAAVYVRGSWGAGDAVPVLSDVDLAVVVPTGARARVRRRWLRARRGLGDRLFDWPLVLEPQDLLGVAPRTAFTYGLDSAPAAALYAGPHADDDPIRLAERPELYAPTSDWRLARGPEVRPPERPRAGADRAIAGWLMLQNWWRLLFAVCVDPSRPPPAWTAYLCVKLCAEPARIWLWLAHGERLEREPALRRAIELLPEEEESLSAALALAGSLSRSPAPPLGAVVAHLVRMSSRIAGLLDEQARAAGLTEVALSWRGSDELTLPFGGWEPGASPLGDEPEPALLPLLDWRGLVIPPPPPDETLAPIAGDPADVGRLAAAAQAASGSGPCPALHSDGLLVQPDCVWWRTALRAVQCEATDPVSFALVEGRAVALFGELPGLSARDRARRAVAEHRAWLFHRPPESHSGWEAGRLVAAARAALFLESMEAERPELTLTVAATLRALAARGATREAVAVAREYAEFAVDWREVSAGTLTGLRRAVTALPCYAEGVRSPCPAPLGRAGPGTAPAAPRA